MLVSLIAVGNLTGLHPQQRRGRAGLPGPDRRLALVHRPLRHLRRGGRGGPRTGPGGDAPADQIRHDRSSPGRRRDAGGGRLVRAAPRRPRRGPRGRGHPRRRRCRRGRRVRQRVRHHGRVGARPQGAGHRHPEQRDRRDDPHQRHPGHPHHGRPGRDIPGPDDRPRRRGEAPGRRTRSPSRSSCRGSRSSSSWPSSPSGRSACTPARRWRRWRSALLVCLIPTTIGGLLSAIGIAGMDRVARFNVLAMSGRAVEASGDVDVILLDKTGTITYGNRMAASVTPAAGIGEREAMTASLVASVRDETPEGRSIVDLARERLAELGAPAGTGDEAGYAGLAPTWWRRSRSARRPVPAAPGWWTARSCSRARSTPSRPASTAPCPPELTGRQRHARRQGATPLALCWTAGSSGSSSSRTRSRRASSSGSPSSAGWASGRSW